MQESQFLRCWNIMKITDTKSKCPFSHQSAGSQLSVSSLTWQSLFTLALYSDTDCQQEMKIKSIYSNIGHYRGDNGLHELVISLATSDNQSGLKQLENKIL